MVRRLMAFNPSAETRMDIKESLAHPYMKQFVTGDEQTCPAILTVPIDDDIKYTVSDYRDKLYSAVVANRKDKDSRLKYYCSGRGR